MTVSLAWAISSIHLFLVIQRGVRHNGFPLRWLLLSFLPFFGDWFFSRCNESRAKSQFIIQPVVVNRVSPPQRNISNAVWVLSQEHYDPLFPRRTGSTLTALRSNCLYSFKKTNRLPRANENIIRVPYPKFDDPDYVWAHLRYDSHHDQDGWRIINKSDTPILLEERNLQNSNYETLLPDRESKTLLSSSYLYIGAGVYSLNKLPRIGVRWRGENNPKYSEPKGHIHIGSYPSADCYIKEADPIIATFEFGNLYGIIECLYKPLDVNKPKKVTLSKDTPLSFAPGEMFYISNFEFLLDYIIE